MIVSSDAPAQQQWLPRHVPASRSRTTLPFANFDEPTPPIREPQPATEPAATPQEYERRGRVFRTHQVSLIDRLSDFALAHATPAEPITKRLSAPSRSSARTGAYVVIPLMLALIGTTLAVLFT